MSRHPPHRVRHQVRKQVLFLSRTALNIWHRCHHTRALPNGKRFSLLSPSPIDYRPTVTAQHVRNNLHHLSASSEQIFGFHVVCGQCEGFVVRDGVVRNCEHMRESWCSGLSNRSGEVGRGGVGMSEDAEEGREDVRISVQPPTPVASPELDTRGNGQETVECDSRDPDRVDEGRVMEAETLQPVPTILRPGRVRAEIGVRRRRSSNVKVLESVPTILRPGPAARTREVTRKAIGSGASSPSRYPMETRITADDGLRLHTKASNPADTDSVDGEDTDQSLAEPDALMQSWKAWSESWEKSVARVNSGAKKSHSATTPHCDADALMQEWREWSVRWERSVRSR